MAYLAALQFVSKVSSGMYTNDQIFTLEFLDHVLWWYPMLPTFWPRSQFWHFWTSFLANNKSNQAHLVTLPKNSHTDTTWQNTRLDGRWHWRMKVWHGTFRKYFGYFQQRWRLVTLQCLNATKAATQMRVFKSRARCARNLKFWEPRLHGQNSKTWTSAQ